MKNAMQLKAIMKNLSKEKHISAHLLLLMKWVKKIPKVAAYCVFLPIKKSMSKVLSHRYTII